MRSFLGKLFLFIGLFILTDHLAANFLRSGLERYFGLNTPSPVLLIGHSHTVLGIDKQHIEKEIGFPVAKYARQGANLSNRLAMIRHYLSLHPTALDTIVYDVDAHLFNPAGLSENSHRLFYPFMDTPVIRKYIKAHADSTGEYWLRRWLKLPRFSEVTLALSMRGWLKKWTNLKFGQVNTAKLQKEVNRGDFRKIIFDPEQIVLFEETVRLVRSKGIHLALLYIPTIDIFNQAEPDKYQTAIDLFSKYAAEDSGITFLNYNPEFADQHNLFYDPIHMNPQGQKKVTERLTEDLKSIRH